MNIVGLGCVFNRGRGIAALESALLQGWIPPSRVKLPKLSKEVPVYEVRSEILSGTAVSRKLRRADKYGKMTALAALDAVQDSGIEFGGGSPRLGVIVSTAFGPHATSFQFLDNILEYGDSDVSPTTFCHSVGNGAAYYISAVLNNVGPSMTLTHFSFPFHHALQLARCWLESGFCDYVLAGGSEECGLVMEHICAERMNPAPDGRIRPFGFSAAPVTVPGEASSFLLLTLHESALCYGRIDGISIGPNRDHRDFTPEVTIIEADGLMGAEAPYRQELAGGGKFAAYTPIFGGMVSGSALSCATAALMLRRRVIYGSPVQDIPSGIDVCTTTQPAEIDRIRSVRYNCKGSRAVIDLDVEGRGGPREG